MVKPKWKKGLPTEPGEYWFYGYRYGKVNGFGEKNKPEFVRVKTSFDGSTPPRLFHIAEGSFLFPNEVEEPHCIPIEFPKPPVLKEENESDVDSRGSCQSSLDS